MTLINRVQAAWDQPGGFKGLNTFYQTGTVDLEPYRQFYSQMAASLPDNVTITMLSSNLQYESETGAVTASYSADPAAAVAGTSTGDFAAAVGAVVRWNTNAFLNNRRVRGRTFIVPLDAASFDTNGGLDASFITGVQGFGDALISDLSDQLYVWHRPVNDVGGQIFVATSSTVPSTPAILRSRRR